MECVTCVCIWLGAVSVGGKWVGLLGLGFTNLEEQGGNGICVCLVAVV